MLSALFSEAAAALRPDPRLTVSEWADAHRVLSPKGSAEPGRWATARTPYLREVMDCLAPRSPIERVVLMKGTQLGGTEAGNNWIGYVIDRVPGPMLAVQPTLDIAKRWSRQRIAPLIEGTPRLRERLPPARTRDSGNTLLSKEFPGGILMIAGANSAAGLRSMPVRFLFLDEVDAYPFDVEGEGDPVTLAIERTATFAGRRKILEVSTPTIQGLSRIELDFAASDQRRYWVPCPGCGAEQLLDAERLVWPDGRPEAAEYRCPECEAAIADHRKPWMLEHGAWRAGAEGDGLTAGFHLSALYSPWLTWADIARRKHAAGKDESKLKVFRNTMEARTWQQAGEAPEWERLFERREAYAGVPAGGLLLTAGVDVQRDRIEVSVWAWGRGKESWLVEHRVLEGDTARREVWRALDGMLGETWRHESGALMALSQAAIDSGFAAQDVYAFGRKRRGGRLVIVKGSERGGALVGTASTVEVQSSGKRLRRGVRVFPVAGSIAKLELFGQLRLTREEDGSYPEGYVHLPAVVDAEWCKQLVAERLVLQRNQRGYAVQSWEKTRERNEALDCRVYARAAAALVGLDRFEDRHWAQLEAQVAAAPAEPAAAVAEATSARPAHPDSPPAAAAPARRPWLGGRTEGWMRRR